MRHAPAKKDVPPPRSQTTACSFVALYAFHGCSGSDALQAFISTPCVALMHPPERVMQSVEQAEMVPNCSEYCHACRKPSCAQGSTET